MEFSDEHDSRNMRTLQGTDEERAHLFSHWDTVLPQRALRTAAEPYHFRQNLRPLDIEYTFAGEARTVEDYIEQNAVAGLLVIANGEVAHESYRLGITGTQQLRFAAAPNVGTFAVDPAPGSPMIGTNWAPTVTGALGAPALDVAIVSLAAPIEIGLPFGTLLSNIVTTLLQFNFAPGTAFTIAIPNDCGLVGVNITTQGGSVSFGPLTIGLANGIDIIPGGYICLAHAGLVEGQFRRIGQNGFQLRRHIGCFKIIE